MKAHYHTLSPRIVRAGLRTPCVFKVIAIGLDRRGRFIGIATNLPRGLPHQRLRSFCAEERLIHRSPPSLSRILIARVDRRGVFKPIDPCEKCRKLAEKHNVVIERYSHAHVTQ